MLDGNLTISDREHRFFFAVTAFGLLIRVLEIAIALAFPAPTTGISFGVYSIFDHWDLVSPFYSIVAFAICVPFAWKLDAGTLIPSMCPLVLLTYFFDYWFIDSQILLSKLPTIAPGHELKTFDYVLISGSVFDVLTFLLVNALIVWQANLIYRLFRFSR